MQILFTECSSLYLASPLLLSLLARVKCALFGPSSFSCWRNDCIKRLGLEEARRSWEFSPGNGVTALIKKKTSSLSIFDWERIQQELPDFSAFIYNLTISKTEVYTHKFPLFTNYPVTSSMFNSILAIIRHNYNVRHKLMFICQYRYTQLLS